MKKMFFDFFNILFTSLITMVSKSPLPWSRSMKTVGFHEFL